MAVSRPSFIRVFRNQAYTINAGTKALNYIFVDHFL